MVSSEEEYVFDLSDMEHTALTKRFQRVHKEYIDVR